MSNARVVQMSNAEYHADTTAISHSGLDEILENPAYYYAKRIAKSFAEEPKDYYDFGTRLHNCILRKGDFPAGAKLIPRDALNSQGHRKGAAWKAFSEANTGFELLKEDEPLWQMLKSAQAEPMVRLLLDTDGDYEHTIFWHDDEYDIDLRCRCDFLHLGRDVAPDLKTTSGGVSYREMSNTVARFGYHRQAALYQDGVEEMYGVVPRFPFVFFSKEPPYSVVTFELDDEFIELGREQNATAKSRYAECLHTGKWVPEAHGDIRKLSPPGWVRWEKEWRVTK